MLILVLKMLNTKFKNELSFFAQNTISPMQLPQQPKRNSITIQSSR